jgi:hypothetical protein
MKYFALFQNGSRKEFHKSTKANWYLASVFQMIMTIDDLIDKWLKYLDRSPSFECLPIEVKEVAVILIQFK